MPSVFLLVRLQKIHLKDNINSEWYPVDPGNPLFKVKKCALYQIYNTHIHRSYKTLQGGIFSSNLFSGTENQSKIKCF